MHPSTLGRLLADRVAMPALALAEGTAHQVLERGMDPADDVNCLMPVDHAIVVSCSVQDVPAGTANGPAVGAGEHQGAAGQRLADI